MCQAWRQDTLPAGWAGAAPTYTEREARGVANASQHAHRARGGAAPTYTRREARSDPRTPPTSTRAAGAAQSTYMERKARGVVDPPRRLGQGVDRAASAAGGGAAAQHQLQEGLEPVEGTHERGGLDAARGLGRDRGRGRGLRVVVWAHGDLEGVRLVHAHAQRLGHRGHGDGAPGQLWLCLRGGRGVAVEQDQARVPIHDGAKRRRRRVQDVEPEARRERERGGRGGAAGDVARERSQPRALPLRGRRRAWGRLGWPRRKWAGEVQFVGRGRHLGRATRRP
jgi:hypothetical protein